MALVRVGLVVHHGGGDALAGGIGAVADDLDEMHRQVGIQQGTHVAAAPRDEDDDAQGEDMGEACPTKTLRYLGYKDSASGAIRGERGCTPPVISMN